uniref:Protein-tyrosine-phosphatase n=1 Tax=Cyprinus carpio carpio TaxID=630221 RepID=A0A9J8D996_CYPCA
MAHPSFKTVCKGTALLFFVILLELTAQTHTDITSLPVISNISSTKFETSPQTPPTKPDVIRNLRVSEFTTSSVILRWDEPTGNRSLFRVQWTGDQTNATTNTSYHINGLTAGVNYTFCITAVAADQSTEGEMFCISQNTRPDVIRNLKVTEITKSSVFLIWEEPVGNRSFFKIQWNGDKTSGNSTTSNTSYHITSLIAGVNYTFIITAVAADKSTEGESVFTSNYTKPGTIINLTADYITASTVLLNWTKPNGQSSHFRVEYENNNVIAENTSIEINHLTPGAQYTFRVFAVAADHVTEGRASQVSLYTKPDVIRNLRVSKITTSSVFLTWDEPTGNRSFFKLNWTDQKLDMLRNAIESVLLTTENTSIKINDLTPGAKYTFRVFAVTADHVTEGRASQISLYTKPDVIRNLTVFEITTSSVFLTWDEPFGNRSFFKLNWTDQKLDLIGNAIETTNTSYHITGLTAGVSHTFCITAVAADQSTEGNTFCISQYIKSDGIRNLRVSEITTSSVFLTWGESAGNIYFFKLQWADDKTSGNLTTTYTFSNITGLTAGVNYTFCIIAVAADESTEGETFCISHYTKPEIVRNLSVTEITISSVSLTWDEPAGNRDFFRIQWTEKRTREAATNTSYHINDLTAGVNYTFCITAVAADKSTEGETFCISQYTKPDMIRNLKVTEITTTSVFLIWEEPFGNRYSFKLNWTDEKTSNHVITNNTWYNIIGLTAGVNYTFIITAVAADKSTEGESVVTSNYTKPDVIINLTADDITASSILLNWTKPNGQSSRYRVEYENNNVTTKNTSIKIDHLTHGAHYTFRVFAVAADHVTEGRASQISLYTKPDVIKNLRVSEITTSSVFLTWDEPVGNRSFFKIQWTSDQINGFSATTNTSYNITSLTAGVNYTFTIIVLTADNIGESEPFCISKYTEPDVIRNLRVSEITTSSVFLIWEEPFGNRYFFKLNWTDEKTSNHVITNNTWYNITGLTAGVNYTFNIAAVAADKSTGASVVTSKYMKPDIIMNLTADYITTSSVLLNWTKPTGQSSRFHVAYENNNVTTENSFIEINYMIPGAQYTFRVFAVAADHVTAGKANQISLYTKPVMVRNLRVTEITISSVSLTWDEPVGKRDFFRIQWTEKMTHVTATNTSYHINDLTAGVNYTFCITAVAGDKSTEGETFCISQYTKPNVIRNLKVTEITTTSVFLIWEEPVGNRSLFKIQWTGDKTTENSTSSNTSYHITNLTAGVNYTFNITAVAADKSTEGESVITSNYTKPDVIINLTADDITASSVLLNWTKPNGQSSRYRVEYENNNVTTKNTSIKIDHLTHGEHYTFRVFAVAADHVTEGRASQISLYTKPDVIKNLRVSEITTSSVFLTWDEQVRKRPFFKIQWTGDQINGYSATTNSSYNITSLTAGVNYTFSITALTADDVGESEPFCISKYTEPEIVRNLRVTEITISSVSLTWDEPAGKRDFFRIQWTEKRTHATATNTSYNISDLTAGVNYTFCITAVAGDKSTEGETFCISQYTKSPESNTWLIVGVVLAAICFVFIIILILFFYSKRQTKDQYPDIPLHIFSNTAMRTDDYEDHFKQKHADGFAEEYEKLKTVGIAQSKNAALAIENKKKNRDSNVLPYDASRVKLSVCGSPFYDYINASYVPGYKSREEFIATQCPLPTTVDEFWRMIWEKNIYTIVMLNKCNEQG